MNQPEQVNPYASPPIPEAPADAIEFDPLCYRSGDFLVVGADSVLPNRCALCNEKPISQRTVTVSELSIRHLRRWEVVAIIGAVFAFLFALITLEPLQSKFAIGLLLLVLLGYAIWYQKQCRSYRGEFGLCQKHLRRAIWGRRFRFTMLIGYVVIVGYFQAFGQLAPLIIVFYMLFQKNLFTPTLKKVVDEKFWLEGCGKPFLDSLNEYPGKLK